MCTLVVKGCWVSIKRAWKTAPLCLMWTIWREMNNRTFEGVEQIIDLKYTFWHCLYG